MIVLRGVSCHFGSVQALDRVDLEVATGEIVALLGHNGAGKSTVLRVAAGRVDPSAGTASIDGHDTVAARRAAAARTGIAIEPGRSWFARLSGRANLEYFAGVAGLRRRAATRATREALEAVDLTGDADRPVSGYSTGMRVRLATARACLASPAALLLDEPSAGLDHDGAARLAEGLRALRPTTAVLVATHDLTGLGAHADRWALLDHGRVARTGAGAPPASVVDDA